jgi:inosine-uridine nucleoside N-ribohydrolase
MHRACLALIVMTSFANAQPVPLIYDTDMGNDIDDALALAVIHTLESRGECKLIGVTLTKDNRWAAPYVDLVNTFYGRGDIPIGAVRAGKEPEDGAYIRPVAEKKSPGGGPLYPHDLTDGRQAPEAVALLRRLLAAQPDGAVVIAQVGFSTNLARLLDSKADSHSALAGRDLVARKVRLLSVMGGAFPSVMAEYNIKVDQPASAKVFADWPTPIEVSGFEIGQTILYSAASIENDFSYVEHHPVADAYRHFQKMPYDRETWDLTAVLQAVRPNRNYFGLSRPGTIRVDGEGLTHFAPSEEGKHRFLTVSEEQRIRVSAILEQLASEPPRRMN